MSVEQGEPDQAVQQRWDPLVEGLRELRAAAGEPSYAVLARGLVEQRLRDGQGEYAARIAKSSVYDAFRLGRSRVNLPLTRELARLLGADPGVVDAWLERCRPVVPPPADRDPEPESEPEPEAGRRQVGLLLLGCVLLNLVGRLFVDALDLPLHLDMVGTAVAAIALGPWRGAAVGATTNVLGVVTSGWVSLPFAAVNVAGALLWGFGVRRWRLGTSLPRFLALNVLVGAACSAVAVPILIALDGHSIRHGFEVMTLLLGESVGWSGGALGFAVLLTSVVDKLLSGFVALAVVAALPTTLRRGFDVAAVSALPGTDRTP